MVTAFEPDASPGRSAPDEDDNAWGAPGAPAFEPDAAPSVASVVTAFEPDASPGRSAPDEDDNAWGVADTK